MDFSNLKEFHCTICGKLFNSDGRCPKMLSCGHSFCLACLNKIFPFCKSCPTCRTDILFSSVDLIPVNLLIRSCVSKIDIKSGVKRKDISEYNETENPSSLDIGLSCDAKRKKLLSVGFCNEHEKFNELRCMNCEIWICSMCATLNHKKCDTLLVEDAFIEIQKKNYQIIASQLDVRKSKLAKVIKSLNAVKEKKKLSEQDIVDLKLKIEAKLDQIKDQDIEYNKLIAMIVEEKKKFAKLNEIELLAQSCSNVENIEKLLEAKARLDALSQLLKSDQEPVAQEITTVITVGTVNIDALSQRLKSDQEPVAQCLERWCREQLVYAIDERDGIPLYGKLAVKKGRIWIDSFQSENPHCKLISLKDLLSKLTNSTELPETGFLRVTRVNGGGSPFDVVIKTNGSTPRAKNFILLCSALKGVSYKGFTMLHRVGFYRVYPGPRTVVDGISKDNSDNVSRVKGRGIFGMNSNDSWFNIDQLNMEQGQLHSQFGIVQDGFQNLKNCKKDVSVVQCGLVI